jgi:plasmid stability protein
MLPGRGFPAERTIAASGAAGCASIASRAGLMGAITIRNLDDTVIAAIKRRAANNNVSMEEEIRRLLAATYSDHRQERGREWARRQLELLKRGKLPRAKLSSVEEIRAMRQERTEHLERTSKGHDERSR